MRADAPDEVLCSGTLIAPRVVLTAAHCGVSLAPEDFVVVTDARVAASAAVFAILDARAHPDFLIDQPDADLALLLLGEAPPIAPLGAFATPVLTQSVRIVGYGRTAGAASDADRRRAGEARVSSVEDEHVVLAPDPSLPCGGDSGGPVLDASAGSIVAVVSRGDPACDTAARAARVDVHLDDFVTPTLADWTSPGLLGDACNETSDCVEGECASLEAGRLCTIRCAARACPDGFTCTHTGSIDLFCAPDPPPPSNDCAASRGARRGARWSLVSVLSALWAFALIRGRSRRRPSCRRGSGSRSHSHRSCPGSSTDTTRSRRPSSCRRSTTGG